MRDQDADLTHCKVLTLLFRWDKGEREREIRTKTGRGELECMLSIIHTQLHIQDLCWKLGKSIIRV